ncbi:MAG: lipid A deacylase LpxR family protein [Geminicoccaceae bacterium]|nr:MAG: lipid A deacylase LpxR family protein [Geminicoccaceae bacterium]
MRTPIHTATSSVLALALLGVLAPAAAEVAPPRDDRGTLGLSIDNDLFGGSDRHYTAGSLLTYRAPTDLPPGWLDRFADSLLPLVTAGSTRRWGLALGQHIFTPEDTDRPNPDPDDRPYAGWLYGVFTLSSATATRYGSLELQLGVVGPAALGEQAQNNVHDFFNIDRALGWDYQLANEPGVNLVYSRLWRYNFPFAADAPDGLAWGIVPNFVVSLGNVHTYAATGAMLRVGRNLGTDFGPPRARPSVAGSAFVDPTDEWGWYLFAGLDGRAVARDIFLDGNTWQDSRSVDKKHFVGDASLGAAVVFPWGRISYVHTFRTAEFEGQGTLAEFGSVTLSVRF